MSGELLTGKRWALQWPSPDNHNGTPYVRHLHTETDRDAWVALNPGHREAVGVRNQHVKAYRDRRKS